MCHYKVFKVDFKQFFLFCHIPVEVKIHQSLPLSKFPVAQYCVSYIGCVYSSLVPGVNITDVICGPVNLINQCSVMWNVSVIVTRIIESTVDEYVHTYMYVNNLHTYIHTYVHTYVDMQIH